MDNEEIVPILAELRSDIKGLTLEVRADKRYRRLTKILFVSVVFDIILSIIIGVIGVRAYHTSHVASRASSAIVVSCNAGNEFRVEESALWTSLVTISQANNPNPTPQQKASLEQFQKFLDKAFVPRDCSHIVDQPK